MKSIVEKPKPGEFDIYHKLDSATGELFKYSLKHSDRIIYCESRNEAQKMIKDSDLNQEQREIFLNRLSEFKFVFYEIQLTENSPSQKILFIKEW